MARITFMQYASHVVREQPDHPRTFDWWQLRHLLFYKMNIPLFVFGIILIFSALLVLNDTSSPTRSLPIIIFLSGMILGGFILASPFIYIWRWYGALRWGRLAYASITDVTVGPPGPGNRSSLEAIEHGEARGTWVINLPEGQLTQRFALDEPWVPWLSNGTTVRVLMHPHKPILWMPVGP